MPHSPSPLSNQVNDATLLATSTWNFPPTQAMSPDPTKKRKREREREVILIDLEALEDELLPEVVYTDGRSERKFTASPDRRKSTIVPPRAAPVKLPWVVWDKVVKTDRGYRVSPGKIVEVLLPGQIRKDATFLYVKTVIKNLETDVIAIRGHNLLRTRDVNGLLAMKCNELVWDVEVDLDDPRDPLIQSQAEVVLNHIHCTREARFTNQQYPALSFRMEAHPAQDQERMEQDGPLIVRWKFLREYPTAKDRLNNTDVNKTLLHLRQEDTEDFQQSEHAVCDTERRELFRGKTTLGGAYIPGRNTPVILRQSETIVIDEDDDGNPSVGLTLQGGQPAVETDKSKEIDLSIETRLQERLSTATLETLPSTRRTKNPPSASMVIDLTEAPAQPLSYLSRPEKPRTRLIDGQKYTYGDSFCGGGGATRGAFAAGLLVRWGLDYWKPAADTWRANFPDATMFEEMADKVINMGRREAVDLLVDILHLSPPCQFWSPAHTVEGKDDDMNSASLFACGDLLDVSKPRIATLEQTFGLANSRFQRYFHCLIRDFTDRGYSIRWKIVPFADWGLPARRHRLIMIASCPGERLPPFPLRTHAPAAIAQQLRLRPHKTVRQTLDSVRRGSLHNPEDMRRLTQPKPPWDADQILPRCMTTSGGQNYHPSGLRDLTLGEYAALQGFPADHKFASTSVKKIIGNSVPPVVGEVLFGGIRKCLEKEDGVIMEVVLD